MNAFRIFQNLATALGVLAAIEHIRDWVLGSNGEWVSMGIPADGSYGIEPGVMFGYPVTCANGEYKIVQGLSLNEFGQTKVKATHQELLEERAAIAHLLG